MRGHEYLGTPDFGDAVEVMDDELPVFWACGVTPQAIVMAARPAFCITHAPGHMLITDLLNSELSDLRGAFTGIIRRGQERGEINPGLDAQAVAQTMVSFFEGLVLQQAADRDIDVWKYVDVMKAMMNGRFWLHRPEGVE